MGQEGSPHQGRGFTGWRWEGSLALPLPSHGAGWCPGSPPLPTRRRRCWSSGPPAWPRGDAPGCSGWKTKGQTLLTRQRHCKPPHSSKPKAQASPCPAWGCDPSSPALAQHLGAHPGGEALSESVLQHRHGAERRGTGSSPCVSPTPAPSNGDSSPARRRQGVRDNKEKYEDRLPATAGESAKSIQE